MLKFNLTKIYKTISYLRKIKKGEKLMKTMLQRRTLLLLMTLLIVLTINIFASYDTIEMVVSPNVLNLQSNGGVLTIHADIAYGLVNSLDLTVNGKFVPISSTFPDSRGDLVVKCDIETVKEIVEEQNQATFCLTVDTTDGNTYSGTDTIKVINKGN